MKNEKPIFYYENTRKQQAKVILLNMVLLSCMLGLTLLLGNQNQADHHKFFTIIKYGTAFAELALFTAAVWLLTHPAKFFITLTNSEFTSFHPTFKQWTFSVNPQEVVEIEHSTDQEAQFSYISVKMNNGSAYYLSPNHNYNRKELYAALASLNPAIKLPTKTWSFGNK